MMNRALLHLYVSVITFYFLQTSDWICDNYPTQQRDKASLVWGIIHYQVCFESLLKIKNLLWTWYLWNVFEVSFFNFVLYLCFFLNLAAATWYTCLLHAIVMMWALPMSENVLWFILIQFRSLLCLLLVRRAMIVNITFFSVRFLCCPICVFIYLRCGLCSVLWHLFNFLLYITCWSFIRVLKRFVLYQLSYV